MRKPRVLYIDLTAQRSHVEEREDLSIFLGGTGLATELFLEKVLINEDPLHPSQPLVIANGFLAPYFPVATKSIAIFYSPLNSSLGESHAGGRLACAMKLADLDAMVITGKSDVPCYLSIFNDMVKFNNAYPLWGLNATVTATYIREKEGMAGLRSVLRIGPGGESKTAFSMVIVDTYRHFGRLGMGAVLGSKGVKAIHVGGEGKNLSHIVDFDNYKVLFEELHKKSISGVMRKYHEYGTAMNILPLNEMKSLPTKNLLKNNFEYAEEISGEAFAEHTLTKKFACAGCPLGCIHIATRRTRFAEEEEWERNDVSYDYELIYALGSLLGISNREEVLMMIEYTEELGLDAIYTGVFLAWVTEAFQKGLLKKDDIGVEKLAFGDRIAYIEILRKLVTSKDEFYKLARKGLHVLTEKYGGQDFALLVGKNALAGYHTGHANLIGQSLIGIRHAHTDNAGYSLDQENPDSNPKEAVEVLFEEEVFRSFYNCTGLCLFARKLYSAELIKKAASTMGIDLDEEKMKGLGLKIYLKKMKFKKRCGFNIDSYQFPSRFFETNAGGKPVDKIWIETAKSYFSNKIDVLLDQIED